MNSGLLLHLMLRHGVDAFADALLDGCARMVRQAGSFAMTEGQSLRYRSRAMARALSAGVHAGLQPTLQPALQPALQPVARGALDRRLRRR